MYQPRHTYPPCQVFTHRDHIGCQAEWHAAFPTAKRVIHAADAVEDTSGFELVLSEGETTWTLPGWVWWWRLWWCCCWQTDRRGGGLFLLPRLTTTGLFRTWSFHRWEAKQLALIHLPGHTSGSVFIQYKQDFLFTGDSLHYSRADGRLTGFRCGSLMWCVGRRKVGNRADDSRLLFHMATPTQRQAALLAGLGPAGGLVAHAAELQGEEEGTLNA